MTKQAKSFPKLQGPNYRGYYNRKGHDRGRECYNIGLVICYMSRAEGQKKCLSKQRRTNEERLTATSSQCSKIENVFGENRSEKQTTAPNVMITLYNPHFKGLKMRIL